MERDKKKVVGAQKGVLHKSPREEGTAADREIYNGSREGHRGR